MKMANIPAPQGIQPQQNPWWTSQQGRQSVAKQYGTAGVPAIKETIKNRIQQQPGNPLAQNFFGQQRIAPAGSTAWAPGRAPQTTGQATFDMNQRLPGQQPFYGDYSRLPGQQNYGDVARFKSGQQTALDPRTQAFIQLLKGQLNNGV